MLAMFNTHCHYSAMYEMWTAKLAETRFQSDPCSCISQLSANALARRLGERSAGSCDNNSGTSISSCVVFRLEVFFSSFIFPLLSTT
jgi:hypothetical protein